MHLHGKHILGREWETWERKQSKTMGDTQLPHRAHVCVSFIDRWGRRRPTTIYWRYYCLFSLDSTFSLVFTITHLPNWSWSNREKYKNCFLKIGRNALNREKLRMLQNLLLIHGDLQLDVQYTTNKKQCQQLTCICFEMILSYILNIIGNENMRLTSIFGASIS